MKSTFWKIQKGNIPLMITAIHNGHSLFSKTQNLYQISEDDRLREEAPYTSRFAQIKLFREIVPYGLVVDLSRFACDLNRPPEAAIYTHPEDSWGEKVWKMEPVGSENSVRVDFPCFFGIVLKCFPA